MQHSKPCMRRGTLFMLLYVFFMPFIFFHVQAGMVLEPPQFTVSGTVTDTSGNPLAGVNLVVESKNIGTISDLDGSFTINAGPSDVLVFSMVSFKTLSVPIGGREKIIISLEEDVTVLGEVVLNAGYYTVSDRDRTGSIATIKAGVIDKQPVTNPLAAMQGHLSGVNIVQATGVPGGGFSIEVRGRNFINGVSDPLFIVDGVPFGSQSLGALRVSNEILGANVSPLNAINPNDIESIEVLKDADATAIYGSRGANGVVLITTKKGKSGKTQFDAHVSSSLGQVTHFLDLMDTEQYLEVRREGVINDGYGSFLENPDFDYVWPDLKSWDNSRYTDWQKELIGGTAYRNNAQLSVSGGGQNTHFLISGAYQKETTVFPGDSNYQRGTLRSQVDHSSSNGKFKVNMSLSYSNERNQMPGADFTSKAYSLEPNAPALYDADGNINWENNTWDNPYAALEEEYVARSKTVIANSVISYELLQDLELRASLGFTDYRLDSYRTMLSSARNPRLGATPLSYSNLIANGSQRQSWIVEPQLHWKRALGDFSLDILLGTTFQRETTDQLVIRGLGFSSNALIHNLAAARNLEIITDRDSEYRYNAVFGRINLKLLDRYIVNLTGRRDGSSRFGPGKQFGNFGAMGVAWLFSEENFIGAQSLLSYGKLRASYGTTGSDQIGDYQYLDSYSVTGNDYNGVITLEPTGIYNPQFGWEENRKLEAALELGFFKDRLLLTTAWYRNRSSNQLVGIPLAATTGFTELTGNFDALVENTGFEVDFRTRNIQSPKVRWSTTFNLTIPKNRLVAFDGLDTSTFANRYVIGEPLSIVKVYHALGVDPETGLYQFEDYNGDGAISSSGDRQWIEDLAPKFFGGLGNTIQVGNFTLDAFFQFKKQKAYNITRFQATPGFRGNKHVDLYDRWQNPGDIVSVQKAFAGLAPTGGLDGFQMDSNAAISDASFIRLRNVSLNYSVPSIKEGLDINVYVQGQNLWTITNYNGPDPEQSSGLRLPPLRQITLGLQVSF